MSPMTMAAVLLGAAALSYPLGRWMAAVFEAPSPAAGSRRAAVPHSARRRRPGRPRGPIDRRLHPVAADLQCRPFYPGRPDTGFPGRPARQSRPQGPAVLPSDPAHRLLFRHQHQLAALLRGGRPQPDGPGLRPDGPPIPLGRDRPGRAGRPGPRPVRPRPGREFSSRRRFRLALCPASLVPPGRGRPRPGRGADDLGRCRHGPDAGRRNPDHRPRPRGRLRGHQAAGLQRRRLFRPQFRPSLREPVRADQLRRDAGHAHPADGLRLDVRPDDPPAPARRRRVRGHGRHAPGQRRPLPGPGHAALAGLREFRGRSGGPELGGPGAALRALGRPVLVGADDLPGQRLGQQHARQPAPRHRPGPAGGHVDERRLRRRSASASSTCSSISSSAFSSAA